MIKYLVQVATKDSKPHPKGAWAMRNKGHTHRLLKDNRFTEKTGRWTGKQIPETVVS